MTTAVSASWCNGGARWKSCSTSVPVHVKDEKRFAGLVNQAFSQRRKTLRNALKGLLTAEEIASLAIDPMRRPETLSLADYALLSNAVKKEKGER